MTLDFLSSLLKYSPKERIIATDAILHPFFDSIRKETAPSLMSGGNLEFEGEELINEPTKLDLHLKKLDILSRGEVNRLFTSLSNAPTPLQSSGIEGSTGSSISEIIQFQTNL